MLRDITIRNFRCFSSFEAKGLTLVNLFVGKNNVGKTSLLEAVELLWSNSAAAILKSPSRRNELIVSEIQEERQLGRQFDISHLFFKHRFDSDASFEISSKDTPRCFECFISYEPYPRNTPSPEMIVASQWNQSALPLEIDLRPGLRVVIDGKARWFPLTSEGSLFLQAIPRMAPPGHEAEPVVNFLGTREVEADRLQTLWDAVVLSPEEERVVDALRIVEPGIDRIAFIGDSKSNRSVFLKLADVRPRIPLGSAGDGMKRLLALALNLIPAAGGAMLVDEIDTGLHYTVLTKMWDLVIQTARRLNVQVFATTHSMDCVQALAATQGPEDSHLIGLHRLEGAINRTVRNTLEELSAIAETHIEVR